MIHSLLLHEYKELAARLASELTGVEMLEHREGWAAPEGATAYATWGQHIGIRDELRLRGRWRGSWPSCVVFVERPTIGVLLHELAHLLPAKPHVVDTIGEASPADREIQRVAIAAIDTDIGAAPWLGHGPDWIRRVLCLHYRAERLGLEIPLDELHAAGRRYGLSMVGEYADALGYWPQTMARWTFNAIDAEPLPPAFARLWNRDVREHYTELAIEHLVEETA